MSSPPRPTDAKVAEVVEATTTEFVAQCYDLHRSPPFGSLVRTSAGEAALYGLVYSVTTSSIDPGRRPVARGQHEESEEAMYRHHPQLAQLFRTEFRALAMGWETSEGLKQQLPPSPARVHAFVFPCSEEELRSFGASEDYLALLVSSRLPVVDELIAAGVRMLSQVHPDPVAFRVATGKRLAQCLSGEAQRLSALLRRLR